MRCDILAVGDRIVGFVCGGNGRPSKTRSRRCPFCKRADFESNYRLCDFVQGNNKTCDAPFCSTCGKNVGPNEDLCPIHTSKLALHQERQRFNAISKGATTS